MKKIVVVGWLMAGLLVCGCTSRTESVTETAASGGPLTVTDQDFEQQVLRSSTPVMVDFWAEWCLPCRLLAPTVEALAVEYQGRVVVAKLDVDANPETAKKYEITGIPAMLFFKDGQLVKTLVGNQPKDEIARVLDSLLGS